MPALLNTRPHTRLIQRYREPSLKFSLQATPPGSTWCVESPRHQNKRRTRPCMERPYPYISNRLSKHSSWPRPSFYTPCLLLHLALEFQVGAHERTRLLHMQSAHPAIPHARNHEILDLLPLKLLSLTSHTVKTTERNQKCRSHVQTRRQETQYQWKWEVEVLLTKRCGYEFRQTPNQELRPSQHLHLIIHMSLLEPIN